MSIALLFSCRSRYVVLHALHESVLALHFMKNACTFIKWSKKPITSQQHIAWNYPSSEQQFCTLRFWERLHVFYSNSDNHHDEKKNVKQKTISGSRSHQRTGNVFFSYLYLHDFMLHTSCHYMIGWLDKCVEIDNFGRFISLTKILWSVLIMCLLVLTITSYQETSNSPPAYY